MRWAGKSEANGFPDKMQMKLTARRDGRVAEGARLESVYTFTGIGGSNPSLSAKQSELQEFPLSFPTDLANLCLFFVILARQTGPRRTD